jgi:excisionase family DNA binding protein
MSKRGWLDRRPDPSDRQPGRMLKVSEVAELLSLSISHTRRLISIGALPVHRVGIRALRISDADVAAFLAKRRRGK